MQDRILLAHGGGAELTGNLISEMIQSRFGNDILNRFDDSAVLPAEAGRLAFTSDSFVVSPLFFPGGNIGDLAVCGTVNDLAMAGAEPRHLSLSLILEEGLPVESLAEILDAVKKRAEQAEVLIVTGDTKVVPRGEADGIYINTAGIGVIPDEIDVSSAYARAGDVILISGAPGLHGLAVMLARGNLNLESPVRSDVAPLNHIIAALVKKRIQLRVLRDLTRGGLAMALMDIAKKSEVTAELIENDIPVNEAQTAACDILGIDLMHIASEGRFLAVVPAEDAAAALEIMQGFDGAVEAAVIGSIQEKSRYAVQLVTPIGSKRVVSAPRGEQMPRIC